MIPMDTIKLRERNPRTITAKAFAKLCASIQRDPQFMEIRPIVVDEEGVILGGNMRFRACQQLGMTELPDSWVIRASKLTPEQRRRFVLVDNAPEGMAGEWDTDILAADFELEELGDLGFDLADVTGDEKYVTKIAPPVYQVTGAKPSLSEMVDAQKTGELMAAIQAADIPDEARSLLVAAATRHTVFHYGNIAEFYAHADPVVKDLMEKSGLVIIDYEKAIENGFVRLSKTLAELTGKGGASNE